MVDVLLFYHLCPLNTYLYVHWILDFKIHIIIFDDAE